MRFRRSIEWANTTDKAQSSIKCYGCLVAGPDWLASPGAVIAAAVFGALWGSFMNVCIVRVPRRESVVRTASHCFACGRPIRAFDNIPLLSYLCLRGRCRSCGARFSPRYLLVEALAALLSALVYWKFVASAPAEPAAIRVASYAVYFVFTGVLIVLSFIDLDSKRIPDVITLPAIPMLYGAAFGAHDVSGFDRALGAAGGYLAVRIIADGYYYLTGREGLGLGDGKLLALIGAVLGWKAIPVIVFLGSCIGVAVSVPLLLARQRRPQVRSRPEAAPDARPPVRHAEVPFGPFLSLSALVYLLFGDPLAALVERLLLAP